jgi:hypothetical protein
MEWYIQDNWRVSKRLTLDFGLRLYHMRPMFDENGITASLNPGLYVPAKAPALYVPTIDASGRRVAKDPLTGAPAAAPLIGQFVPGSDDFANGSRVAGQAYPDGLYTRSALAYGPRFGFAYDVFGNGRTALRAGFGMFKDTSNADPLQQTIGNPPVTHSPTAYYGSLDTYAKVAEPPARPRSRRCSAKASCRAR